jgi:hypothetical protein
MSEQKRSRRRIVLATAPLRCTHITDLDYGLMRLIPRYRRSRQACVASRCLSPIDISEAYARVLETGRRDGKGGLLPRTVNHMHRVLYSALNQAERWKIIVRNPAALLEKRDRPKIERRSVKTIGPP